MSTRPSTCLVVAYHYVRDAGADRFQHVHAAAPDRFEQQLAVLLRDRRLLDYATCLDALNGRRPLARPSLLLTFDDGVIDHYRTVFPVLQAIGATGIFFVSSGCVEPRPRVLNVQKVQLLLASLGGEALWEKVLGGVRTVRGWTPGCTFGPEVYRYDAVREARLKHLLNYQLPFEVVDPLLEALFRRHVGEEAEVARTLYLSASMIREMARAGMTFGYHTRQHRVLARLSEDQQRAEIQDGVRWIRALTGQRSVPFCYPHGHAHAYTLQTVRILRESGYSMAFTAVRGLASLTSGGRFELPRCDTRDLPPFEDARPGRTATGVPDEAKERRCVRSC